MTNDNDFKTKTIEVKLGAHTLKKTVLDAPPEYLPAMGDHIGLVAVDEDGKNEHWEEWVSKGWSSGGLGSRHFLLAQAPKPVPRTVTQVPALGIEVEGEARDIAQDEHCVLISREFPSPWIQARRVEDGVPHSAGVYTRYPAATARIRAIGTTEWRPVPGVGG